MSCSADVWIKHSDEFKGTQKREKTSDCSARLLDDHRFVGPYPLAVGDNFDRVG